MSSMNSSGSRRSAAGRGSWLRAALPLALFVACVSADHITGLKPGASPRLDLGSGGGVVISQVYGGGGNAGATLTNDFIELHNAGPDPVSLAGWSVQYASAAGTTWQVTTLSGTIASGGYYLVQEAKGSGGTVSLPTPDATGTIAMSATGGKVALASGTSALTGSCPAAIDFVGFGTANCAEALHATPPLTNTTAALRKDNGNTDTNDNAADFDVGAPAPRNSASPHNGGGGGTVAGPLDHVVLSGGTSVEAGRTLSFTAALQDANGQTIADPATVYAWTSTDESIARVTTPSANPATVTGVAVGGPVTITVSATSHGVTKSATAQLTVIPRVLGHVTLSAGTSPLVIGYQTQLFVGGTDDSGHAIDFATITWSTSNPAIVSIDSRGLITGAGDGTAVLTATAPDGSKGSFTMTTEVPIYSSTARTGHNVEFGVPTDADPSNDVIIERKQYTISYNPQRGGPNWVSWDLSASHLGTRNRCNCYSADTALVRLGYGQYMYNTLDYTGSGYDRGHMEPSADQTTTDGENATTFFLTNFLPQQHGLNAGPWEALENALRDSVNAGREAYVIAGGVFTNGVGLGSINGKIQIPDSTWKIVVMMPANTGLANVTSASDVDVFAVNMPNVDKPGTNDWTQFRTTVDKIQRSTGYDFLSSLPEAIQCRVEVRNCAPIDVVFAGATILPGETYSASGTFTDTDADSWTASATFGDGSSQALSVTGHSFQLSHTYTSAGSFTVTVTVDDHAAGTGSGSATVVVLSPSQGVANLSALLAGLNGQGLNKGELNSLQSKLDGAAKQLDNGNGTPAANMLGAFVDELQAMVGSGRVSAAAAAPIVTYAQRVIASIR
jgi:DNA/RNA endonuclease G (NUC1)